MTLHRQVILDASALIALMNNEPGYAMIEDIIGDSVMSTVNVSEAAKFLIDRRTYTEKEAQNVIEQLVNDIADFDSEQAYVAASLYNKTKALGLSMGDRACLALSKVTGYTIYTADKIWDKVKIDNINITLIR